MYDVLSIGELVIDFAPVSVDSAGYPTIAANPGGAPGIFCAALSKFGIKTYVYAKVGDDTFGKLLINTLKTAGVETSGIIKDSNVFTTLAFVTLDETGNRSFSFARKPGADMCLSPEELDLSKTEGAKYFHFDTLPLTHNPSREATICAVKYAKNAGVRILFDPNYRPPLWESEDEARQAILCGLEYADVVKISDEEVEFLWGVKPIEGAHRLLHSHKTELVMLTCGAGGAYVINKKGEAYAACPPVKAIDTTGAGDIFAASAIYKMLTYSAAPEDLSGNDLRDIVSFAVKAASISTQTKGGIPGIPELQDI